MFFIEQGKKRVGGDDLRIRMVFVFFSNLEFLVFGNYIFNWGQQELERWNRGFFVNVEGFLLIFMCFYIYGEGWGRKDILEERNIVERELNFKLLDTKQFLL